MQSRTATESHLNLYPGMKRFQERLPMERESRLRNAENVLSFGVSFLDEALGGIYANDLVILGAKTGFGKSQLAILTALHNARAGKRVTLFALEAEEFEIERRIKYQFITDWFFSQEKRPPIYLNYMDWYYGKFDDYLRPVELEFEEKKEEMPNLNIVYRQNEFTAQEFERIFLGVKDDTDLAIIDHLHYFDYDDENENKAVKQIVKRIRDCALITGKPIILVSHVRKSDRRFKTLIPELEDMHGTSDIGKIATKAITIAPAPSDKQGSYRSTYMQILKCRVDGSRTGATGLLAYNFQSQKYEREYYLGKLSTDGSEFLPFNFNELPYWARCAKAGAM